MNFLLLFTLFSCTLWNAPAQWGLQLEGFPISREQVAEEKKKVGDEIHSIGFYLQWADDPQETLSSTLQAIDQENCLPMLTWEPWIQDGGSMKPVLATSILNGEYDAHIKGVANQLKEWGKPLLLRFAHEMNPAQYHWGSQANDYGPKSPEQYIAMWRYVVTLFRGEGVDNVKWVFCPNADSIPNESWNHAAAYFPGDGYVDLFAMDGYDFGPDSRSFRQIFTPLYEEIGSLVKGKPLLVGETATFLQGEERKRWISEMEKTASAWQVAIIFWFQVNKEQAWALP